MLRILRFLIVAALGVGVASMFAPGARLATIFAVYVPLFVGLGICVWLLRLGRVRLAAWTVTLVVFVLVTCVVFLFGGIGANNGVAWTVSAMLAGAVIGRRAAVGFAFAAAALGALAVAAETSGALPESLLPATLVNAWLALTVTIFLVVALHNTAMSSLDAAALETAAAYERVRKSNQENEVRAAQGLALTALAESALAGRSTGEFATEAAERLLDLLGAERVLVLDVDERGVGRVVGAAGGSQPHVELEVATVPGAGAPLSAPEVSALAAALGCAGKPGWAIAARGRERATSVVVVLLPAGADLGRAEVTFLRVASGLVGGAFERARAEARALMAQKMELVGRLAAGVAHDFNTLLSAVMGVTDELRPRDAPPELVADLSAAAERAALLTRQLLAFSRRAPARREPLDLSGLISGFVPMLRRVLTGEIKVNLETPPNPVVVNGDRSQLEQLLLNLVVNARDAMPRGGELRLSLRAQSGHVVCLEVADTGMGMDAATRARAFELFFSTKSEGTGLGLATVRDIAERHGGRVSVSSEAGFGTTFKVELPLAVVAESALRAPTRPLQTAPVLRVLLVEDNDLVRASTVRLLKRMGHNVTAVCDGGEAIEAFAGEKFDIMVSDVAMPVLSGHDLVDRLDAAGGRPPTVLISGYDERHVLAPSAGRAGIVWLAKPFTLKELAEAIHTVREISQ